MSIIKNILAREILDSRGMPTVEVDITLDNGFKGRASVPSGASTGAHEAVELRDNDPNRFFGKGVLKAVHSVNTEIKGALLDVKCTDQKLVDEILITLDGTSNKERLGANAILGVSLAVSKAAAKYRKIPLFKYLGGEDSVTMPVPMMNIVNGGAHANNSIDIQEFMIIPVSASTFSEACLMGCEVYKSLQLILQDKNLSTAVGDEGGFAPDLKSTHECLNLIMASIEKAGLTPGSDVYLAIDCAATEYYNGNKYQLSGEGLILDIDENVDYLKRLVDNYPIISIEDGMAEDDWEGWSKLTKQMENSCNLVGDDLFVTNSKRLIMGIEKNLANSILIKPNQIGTLSETLDTISIANENGYSSILSHRSGETEDTTIADLSVATNCGQIKTGSMSRSDRLCKYNQLIRIEEELGDKAEYFGSKILPNK